MKDSRKMKLVLEDGSEFAGVGFGEAVVGEIVFNTSMVGYQEILSDPAYAGRIVLMTYPLIGQYGIMDEDYESRAGGPAALVVRECCGTPSNFRYTKTLPEDLEDRGITCMARVDTRMATRILREGKVRRAAVVDEDVSVAEAQALITSTHTDENPVAKVSCRKRWFSRTPQHTYDVLVIDCGMKHGIVSALNALGCNVTVVPFDTAPEDMMAFNPDGLLFSGGPGSPAALPSIVSAINSLKGRLPIFGIGLGHQLISLSYGAELERMVCGHHGDHPVRCLSTGKIYTVGENHDFAVKASSLKGTLLTLTHVDVADGTVEGVECPEDRVCSVQFYPEGRPGPCETDFFEKFVKMMED